MSLKTHPSTLEPASLEHERRAIQRRRVQRFLAFDAPVLLGWWERTRFHTVAGQLQDVSITGAAAVAKATAPAGARILVRLTGSRVSDWVEAVVIEARCLDPKPAASYLVRMRFPATCPYAFFTGAITRRSAGRRPLVSVDRRGSRTGIVAGHLAIPRPAHLRPIPWRTP